MNKTHLHCGFSLVEVTLALGIAAFTMIAIFGLLPLGMNASHSASEQAIAANAAAAIVADLRQTAWTGARTSVYGIPPNVGGTIRLDDGGALAVNSDGRYRATVRIAERTSDNAITAANENSVHLNPNDFIPTRFGLITISWPANANPSNALGKYELLFALPRSN